MPDIDFCYFQEGNDTGGILALQKAGVSTSSAEALLERMLDRIDELCAERDRLKAATPIRPSQGKALGGQP